MENKPTVVFDFDGVIHSYKSGWQGEAVIPDPPVPGIRETISELRTRYNVVIQSARARSSLGLSAIRDWLLVHDIVVDDITSSKPPALVYIDDRAICFDGNSNSLISKVDQFKPWYL